MTKVPVRLVNKIIFVWVMGFALSTHTNTILAKDKHAHHDHMMMHSAPTAEQLRQYTGRENAVVTESVSGDYRFTLYSGKTPIPLKTIHDWILHIETLEGKPVEDARVFINGGMPMHQHGFPTKPRVKEYLGNGNYRVEGIKFNMPGYWEMRFNIKHAKKRDRAVFKIHLGY